MKAFNHILCAYDFSEYADKALSYAIKLANCSANQLSLIHVLINPFLFEGGSPILSQNVLAKDLLEKMRKDDKEKLDALKLKLSNEYPDLRIDLLIEESNDIGDALITAQKKLNGDLIIMGSHGRKGLNRVLMGSVAESVLRDAECPILIVK